MRRLALLFEQTPRQSASEASAREHPPRAKYRRIPRRISRLLDFQLSDAQWNDLLIPINMAFFFHSTPSERVVAMYPSPAGAVESLLQLDSWTEMLAANPLLAKMEPDVEALLVNRIGRAGRPHGYPNDGQSNDYSWLAAGRASASWSARIGELARLIRRPMANLERYR